MQRNLLFYIATLVIFGTGIAFILQAGSRLEQARIDGDVPALSAVKQTSPTPAQDGAPHSPVGQPSSVAKTQGGTASGDIGAALRANLRHPLSILLLQVVVIVLTARAVGSLFARIGQPSVIGEMVAGILLGPSLLGWLAPGAMEFLFPAASMDTLKLLSQVGVILFMFVVGMELDVDHLREKAHAAVVVSHASIIFPFFLGTTLSLFIYTALAPPHITFSGFALFMGIAMSITAFPVLARILEERKLTKTYLGSTAIACAAVDDVTAWCLLALVVTIVKSSALTGALVTVVLSLLFMGLMLLVLKPQFTRMSERYMGDGNEGQSKGLLAVVMAFVLTCALFTEVIGIHALFGAFLAGVIMPVRASFRKFLEERIGTFSSGFLLPLFFAFTGLRTEIGLLNDWQSWLMCLGIILVAIMGKLGGSMVAARWTGMSWHDSFAIGALMNTRGLMELIVLNIGYEMGILSPRIFAMMVLMALATTFMTGPLLAFGEWLKRRAVVVVSSAESVA